MCLAACWGHCVFFCLLVALCVLLSDVNPSVSSRAVSMCHSGCCLAQEDMLDLQLQRNLDYLDQQVTGRSLISCFIRLLFPVCASASFPLFFPCSSSSHGRYFPLTSLRFGAQVLFLLLCYNLQTDLINACCCSAPQQLERSKSGPMSHYLTLDSGSYLLFCFNTTSGRFRVPLVPSYGCAQAHQTGSRPWILR